MPLPFRAKQSVKKVHCLRLRAEFGLLALQGEKGRHFFTSDAFCSTFSKKVEKKNWETGTRCSKLRNKMILPIAPSAHALCAFGTRQSHPKFYLQPVVHLVHILGLLLGLRLLPSSYGVHQTERD